MIHEENDKTTALSCWNNKSPVYLIVRIACWDIGRKLLVRFWEKKIVLANKSKCSTEAVHLLPVCLRFSSYKTILKMSVDQGTLLLKFSSVKNTDSNVFRKVKCLCKNIWPLIFYLKIKKNKNCNSYHNPLIYNKITKAWPFLKCQRLICNRLILILILTCSVGPLQNQN